MKKDLWKFEKYVAAVEMASITSAGSGDLNAFDHVAKDLHEEGFLDRYEALPRVSKNACRITHNDEVGEMARERYLREL